MPADTTDTPSLPSIIFIHGAWHDPSVWDALRADLESHYHSHAHSHSHSQSQNLRTHTFDLVSTGVRDPAPDSHLDDVVQLQDKIKQVIDTDRANVVLVAHSYGGMPMSGAVEGFNKAAGVRELGVIGCVFVCAHMIPTGDWVAKDPLAWWERTGEGIPTADLKLLEGNDKYSIMTTPHHHFYNDISPEEAQPWIDKLRPHALPPSFSPAKSEAWRFVPCTMIMATLDNVFPIGLQKELVEKNEKNSRFPIRTYELVSSHSPFLKHVSELSQIIRDAVGEYQEITKEL